MFYSKHQFYLLVSVLLFSGLHLDAERLSDNDFEIISGLLSAYEVDQSQTEQITKYLSRAKRRRMSPSSEGGMVPEVRVSDEENLVPQSPQLLPRKEASSNLEISPYKAKKDGGVGRAIRNDVIYVWIALRDGDLSYVPPHDIRFDFSAQLAKRGKKVTRRTLFETLAELEQVINDFVSIQPNFFHRVIYVGLSEKMGSRILSHKYSLRELEGLEITDNERAYLSSKKVNFYDEVRRNGFTVRLSGLVFNVPKQYKSLLEVMVGSQLDALHKGGSRLGDKAAWARFAEYAQSAQRKSVTRHPIDTLHNQTIRCLLQTH